MTFPSDLSSSTIALIATVAALGAVGGLAHIYVDETAPKGKWVMGAVIGVVAALGSLAFTTPTTLEQLGLYLLAGFFGRAVLSTLQARVTGAVAVQAERTAAAKDLADHAITKLDAAGSPDTTALRARLSALR